MEPSNRQSNQRFDPLINDHIVILHDRLAKRRSDRYIINLALGLRRIGFNVTLITSQFDGKDTIGNAYIDNLNISYSGWWIPRSLFGFFRNTLSHIRATWMASKLALFPPVIKPKIVLMDTSIWALYILSLLATFKLFYVENFSNIKANDECLQHSKIIPTLFQAKWLKLADEIVVETIGFAEILKKSFPCLLKPPRILNPCVDIGLWNEPGINIQRIIPDIEPNTIILLTIAKYRESSNIPLSINAFDELLKMLNDKCFANRLHLVVAGNVKTYSEKVYYDSLLRDIRKRQCASQITFLRQLPIVHEKTLIMESFVMVHPAKNDVYSDFLLRAMSLGKCIVACENGIASKMLTHRLSGVLAPPKVSSFATCLKKLMLSPHLQGFIGGMALDTYKMSYSFDSLCQKMYEIMKEYYSPTIRKKKEITEWSDSERIEETLDETEY